MSRPYSLARRFDNADHMGISEEHRRAARNIAKDIGALPGMRCNYWSTFDEVWFSGTLVTVPGYGISRGPYLRVKRDDHYAIDMVDVYHIRDLAPPNMTDANALQEWLDA